MKHIIENLHVNCLNHDLTHGAIGWENSKTGERLHVWATLAPAVSLDRTRAGLGTLHVNSIAQQGEPGYFKHRSRDPDAKANRALIDEVLRLVGHRDLVAQAIKAERERQAALDAEREAIIKQREIDAAIVRDGPQLLNDMADVVEAIAVHGDYNPAHLREWAHKCRALTGNLPAGAAVSS